MDLDATPAQRRQLEYATQHFGFTPDSLTDTITTFALENLTGIMETMQSHCIKVFAKKVPESEMRESFSLIHEKFTSSTEGVLDDMSSYAKKNILTVPPHIVLPEDRVFLNSKSTGAGYSADQMVEDINYFDRLLATSKTLRYKLAILESKLSNLKRVRDAQSGLSSQARQIDEDNKDLDSVVAEKTQHLKVKMSKLKTLMDKLEKSHSSEEEASDESNDRKRKQEIRSCAAVVTKRLKGTTDSSYIPPSTLIETSGKENQVCLDNTTSTINSAELLTQQ